MLTLVNVSSYDNASSLASLGDKGLFRSANNILQITDAVRPHAVLAMFLDNISP